MGGYRGKGGVRGKILFNSEPHLSLVIKTKVVKNVNRMSEKNILSVCQYVRVQLFSIGIKMKVVKDVNMSQCNFLV